MLPKVYMYESFIWDIGWREKDSWILWFKLNILPVFPDWLFVWILIRRSMNSSIQSNCWLIDRLNNLFIVSLDLPRVFFLYYELFDAMFSYLFCRVFHCFFYLCVLHTKISVKMSQCQCHYCFFLVWHQSIFCACVSLLLSVCYNAFSFHRSIPWSHGVGVAYLVVTLSLYGDGDTWLLNPLTAIPTVNSDWRPVPNPATGKMAKIAKITDNYFPTVT